MTTVFDKVVASLREAAQTDPAVKDVLTDAVNKAVSNAEMQVQGFSNPEKLICYLRAQVKLCLQNNGSDEISPETWVSAKYVVAQWAQRSFARSW